MSDHSAIEWTDATWGPTLGCTKVSDGCRGCYAIRTAYRQEHAFKRPAYAGLTRKLPDGSLNWTGKVNADPERLLQPFKWAGPRRIFVDSQSDLFHEDVPDAFIDQVFAVMAMTEHHTYQVLTKRPERMWRYMEHLHERLQVEFPYLQAVGRPGDQGYATGTEIHWGDGGWLTYCDGAAWPLSNVWLGVSVENQAAARERIPYLASTPAVVRFLSCEPLIGPVELDDFLKVCKHWNTEDSLSRPPWHPPYPKHWYEPQALVLRDWKCPIDWVIAGGESGPGHRPLNLDWVRSLRDQCQAAEVPFLFKQVGGNTPKAGGRDLDGRTWDEFPHPASALAEGQA